MKLKQVLSFLPLVFLVACSTLQHSGVTTDERDGHQGRTLADVYGYILRVASLNPDQLNKENIEVISSTSLKQMDGHYEGDFKIDDSLSMYLQLAQHSKVDLNFFIEFRPMLPPPKTLDQKNINDYVAQLRRFKPEVIRAHCINKEETVNALFKNGWTSFETNLSPSPEDEEGNFYLSSEGGKYITLTVTGNCLEQFTISKGTTYPAYDGIPIRPK